MNAIEIDGVSKRYGSTTALRPFDLRVAFGEVVGILGPNGAGKTTAIQVMLGLRTPSEGSVRLFGMPPASRAARSRVGVMLQESSLPDTLTVEELVRLFSSYYPFTLPADEILRRADLLAKRTSQARTLSGGQRQRLHFALALSGDPDLIVLDEPTVGMDVEARRAFWEQVQEFAALGKTILFSTHYLAEADAMAQRIVVIHEGRVIAQGTPREIKRLVADKTVRMRTDVSLDDLRAHACVQRAERSNDHTVVYTDAPERLLEDLYRDGHAVRDLSVVDTELEAAFVSLTRTGASA